MSLESDIEQIFPVKIKGEVSVTSTPPIKECVTTFRAFTVDTVNPQVILGHVPNRRRALVYAATEFDLGSSLGQVTSGSGAHFIPQLTSPLEIKGTSEVWALATGAAATIYVITEVENG